jgi:hypothetical protein
MTLHYNAQHNATYHNNGQHNSIQQNKSSLTLSITMKIWHSA